MFASELHLWIYISYRHIFLNTPKINFMRPVKFNLVLYQYDTLILKAFNHRGVLYTCLLNHPHSNAYIQSSYEKLFSSTLKFCLLIICYYKFLANRTNKNNFGTFQHGCCCWWERHFTLSGSTRPPIRYNVCLVFQWSSYGL